MKFEFSDNNLERISADAVVLFYFSDGSTREFNRLNEKLHGLLSEEVKSVNFKAKLGEVLAFNTHRKILAAKIFILGLGKKEEFNANALRKTASLLAKSVKNKVSALAFAVLTSGETSVEAEVQAQMIAEGLLLGNYNFLKYKKAEEGQKELEVVVFSVSNKNVQLKMREAIKVAKIYFEGTKLARDLVNEPAAVVNPTSLAKIALDLAKSNKEIECTIYERSQLERMGMGAFLGVAQAADTPPKFIHLEYKPKKSASGRQKLAIVGKGITFDTGGISLKSDTHMQDMKLDMAGAAAVLGVFSVISEIKPPFPVMGIIAATPNLVSSKSIVPGDVVRALNGKTIEILNTDAEGRVTMADSLSYAVKKGATHIIDLATLTGACMVALGENIAALFSNDENFKKTLQEAAEQAGEKVWELPLEKDYKEMNKSEVADISNIPSNRYGGSITAALFLEEFIGNKPWIHLDIAGPAFMNKKYDFGPKGGTGFGVRTLLNLLRSENL